MNAELKHIVAVGMTVAGCWSLQATAQNMEEKDPARWYKEDATAQARSQTLKKEAAAAYRENTAQCRSMSVTERSACLKEAHTIYQSDLALARQALKEPVDTASGK